MLETNLPELLDLELLCQRQAILSGKMRLTEEGNLAALICPEGGELEVKLSFFVDEQQHRVIEAQLKGSVWLLCQRCLESYQEPLESHWWLSPTATSTHYEFLNWDGALLSLRSIVEEEVILSLPMIPRHPVDPKGEHNGCSKI